MRTDRAEQVAQLIRQHQAVEAEREAEARQMAHVLIQNHLGPDHKVRDMMSFYCALVQALQAARAKGQADLSDEVLTLT